MSELGWDSKDTCRISGASVRQLNHWDRQGIISPSVAAGRGSGMRRRYSRADLALLKMAVELRAVGVELAIVADAVATARSTLTATRPISQILERLSSCVLVIDQSGEMVTTPEGQLPETLANRTIAMIVRLDRVRAEIERRVDSAQAQEVVPFDVSGKTYQATVSQSGAEGMLEAVSRAFGQHLGVGKTAVEAIDGLRKSILASGAGVSDQPMKRQTQPTVATALPKVKEASAAGASSWGGDW